MLTPAAARQLAAYNRWMNDKLYQAAASLPHEVLHAERGAFFGSLFGTLSHIVVGDTVWLRRFASLPVGADVLQPLLAWPQPAALDARPAANLAELAALRQQLDSYIEQWAATLDERVLEQDLAYHSMRGDACVKALGGVLLHFFNHQTHHRGQASTLLSQAGVDVGVTDLLVLLPDTAAHRN